MKWQKKTILVPAGVVMTRRDGTRTHDGPLRFRAKREVNDDDEPLDDLWHFPWLNVPYTVLQSEVSICE